MTPCRAPGCKRARRPDSPYCPDCFRAVVLGTIPPAFGRPGASVGGTGPTGDH